MAESKASICNVGLSYIGVSKQVSKIDPPEPSKEAQTCALHYDQARKEVLKEIEWPFATKMVTLGLVATDPTADWGFSYRYPSDCLAVRKILTGIRNDPNPPPYRIGQDDQGKLIYCDVEDCEIEYTKDEENTLRFDAFFDDALSWKMGRKLAPSLSRVKGVADTCDKKYWEAINIATAQAFNEEEDDDAPDAESIRVRL